MEGNAPSFQAYETHVITFIRHHHFEINWGIRTTSLSASDSITTRRAPFGSIHFKMDPLP